MKKNNLINTVKALKLILFCAFLFNVQLNAQGILINTGTSFSLGGSILTLPGDWVNSGEFDPGTGTVIFNGASGDQFIASSLTDTFYNVTINKAAGNVLLGNIITVEGTITLTNGDLDLDGNIIDLEGTAMVSETDGNTLKNGEITGTISLNAPSSQNVFGLGAVITSAEDMGSVAITRGHAEQDGGPENNTSILRYYDITPSNNSGLNATLVFTYDNSELNGKAEGDLILFRSTDTGTTWTIENGTVNTSANTVTLAGINSFSRWTLGSSGAPLPVELSAFTASTEGSSVFLKWQTITETDNYGFEIQRLEVRDQKSANRDEWEMIGFVKGNGTSGSPKEYVYADKNISPGKYNYRLKQIDLDGSYSYSDEIEADVISAPLEFNLGQNYPNPFNPETVIEFTVPDNGNVTLKIYNITGEEVSVLFREYAEAGKYHRVKFNASGLASGIYYASLQFGDKKLQKKMLYIK